MASDTQWLCHGILPLTAMQYLTFKTSYSAWLRINSGTGGLWAACIDVVIGTACTKLHAQLPPALQVSAKLPSGRQGRVKVQSHRKGIDGYFYDSLCSVSFRPQGLWVLVMLRGSMGRLKGVGLRRGCATYWQAFAHCFTK